MAKKKPAGRKSSTKRNPAAATRASASNWDIRKFENPAQIGGIQLAQLTHGIGGAATTSAVALVNTGGGLRYTVALDRGGDIVNASFNQHSLAYLSPVGIQPPSHAYHRDFDWLANWPGGLVTTCGPEYIGHPGAGRGSLHGRFSNTPAHVDMVINPDPRRGRREMLINMTIRDVRVMGTHLEVRRTIQSALGEAQLKIYDQVTNRGDTAVPHHYLYHCNFGYPLVDKGAKLVYAGKAEYWQMPDPPSTPPSAAALRRLKTVPDPLPEHKGMGERGVIVEPKPDKDGNCHVGVVNRRLKLAVEMVYPSAAMPRVANWQHFSDCGAYVTALEPFHGSLMGEAKDSHPKAKSSLRPGQTQRYELTVKVHHGSDAAKALDKYDGDVTLRK